MEMKKENSVQYIKSESQNSFEFGPTKKRFKVYFWTPDELQQKLQRLQEVLQEEKWLEELQ